MPTQQRAVRPTREMMRGLKVSSVPVFCVVLTLATLALVSCTLGPRQAITPDVLRQAQLVAKLLAQQGYTCAPPSQPLENVHMFDELFSAKELLDVRHCQFESRAHGFQRYADGTVTFLFKSPRHPGLAHLAGLTKEGELWANESYASPTDPEFTRLMTGR
jgi:hypothetical protein